MDYVVIGGELMDMTYWVNFKRNGHVFNAAFVECLCEGDAIKSNILTSRYTNI
jgi:hypothetical protein